MKITIAEVSTCVAIASIIKKTFINVIVRGAKKGKEQH